MPVARFSVYEARLGGFGSFASRHSPCVRVSFRGAAFAVPTDLEASAVIGSEPIGEWLLEGDVADSAGLNNGVRVGSPTFVVGNAPSSLGLLFNGVDDGVKADAPVGLNILDQSWTVSAWVQVAVKTEPGPSNDCRSLRMRF